MVQDPPSERTRSVMVVRPKPLRCGRGEPLAVIADAEAKLGRGRLPVLRGAGSSARSTVRCVGLAVTNGVGDAFLNAAIEREVDRLAIGLGEIAERRRHLRVRMAALEADDKLIEKLGELDAAQGTRTKLLEQSAIDAA